MPYSHEFIRQMSQIPSAGGAGIHPLGHIPDVKDDLASSALA
jgi:hypothetical protein